MKFLRTEYFRYKKLGEKWRKPRGMHNKVRRYFGGKLLSPSIGYRSNKKDRGLHPSGYEEVLVATEAELEKLDKNKHAVRFSGKLGRRKKEALYKKAEELGLKVLNAPRFIEPEEEEEE
jgi:large subunit ribosomal protein L32e